MKTYALALIELSEDGSVLSRTYEISGEKYFATAKELGEPGNQFLSTSEKMLDMVNSGGIVRLDD